MTGYDATEQAYKRGYEQGKKDRWISVNDRMPDLDKRVQINYRRHSDFNGKDYDIQTYAVYEDGTLPVNDSNWIGNEDDWMYDVNAKFDEESDCYLIPEGWYEVLTGTESEYVCLLGSNEIVTHWMPSPEPPKEV